MLLKLERRTDQRQTRLVAAHAGQSLPTANFGRQLRAVLFVQQRLVVEQIHLRRTAGLEQEDHAFGRGLMMYVRQHARFACLRRVRIEQLGQRDRSQAQARLLQERSTGQSVSTVMASQRCRSPSDPSVFSANVISRIRFCGIDTYLDSTFGHARVVIQQGIGDGRVAASRLRIRRSGHAARHCPTCR